MRLGPATRVVVPPLRERPADLSFLAHRLVARAAEDRDNSALRAEVARAILGDADAPLHLAVGKEKGASDDGLLLVVPPPVWKRLAAHPWPGNMRELGTVMHSLVSFTLVAAADAIRSGLSISSPRLQVDPGLVGELLAASGGLAANRAGAAGGPGSIAVQVSAGKTLNSVANDIERQVLRELFSRTGGQFGEMAQILLGDAGKARAVRLRFNQLGLKVRELRKG
jgi:DNA-binding NtrC family response regulator